MIKNPFGELNFQFVYVATHLLQYLIKKLNFAAEITIVSRQSNTKFTT